MPFSVSYIHLVVALLVLIFADCDQEGDFFFAADRSQSSLQNIMTGYTGLLVWLLVSQKEILHLKEGIKKNEKNWSKVDTCFSFNKPPRQEFLHLIETQILNQKYVMIFSKIGLGITI